MEKKVKLTSKERSSSRGLEMAVQQLKALRLIFENIHDGACVTDAEGVITHFNRPYGRFLGVDPQAQIGRHITEVVENTRMHIVARTGKAEMNESQSIKGQNMLVQRIPIKENGRVVAVYGQVIFKDVKDVGKLAQKLSELESRVRLYQKELNSLRSTRYTFESIVGSSEPMTRLKSEALKAASTNLAVLIAGESGTGKELFAQSIHNASSRRDKPFIRLNCAAIPKDLLESELFGYDKGAFTGAKTAGKPGKFELAHTGSIFLDEIGDLPLEMQPKLLRALEEKEFERVGGNRMISSDFRLLAASNQNLEEMVAKGTFRSDLYYRLNVVPLHIPPLRERGRDVLLLADHILQQIVDGTPGREVTFTPAAEELLVRHNWPGNVRELNNVIERTLATCEGDRITPADLPFYLHRNQLAVSPEQHSLLKDVVAKAEKSAIVDALKIAEYNKVKAAEILGIHRTLLYKKISRYGISLIPG
ncbi:sigma-54 interaction domain-containing protein [Desulfopila aestuarii]|uniref:PAS domain S-box-containing protein n=1 Tax=Desulfopila aestuarii DSM 18488 TaxID=1121416 RepID=A0A1M7XVI3_9BACT|nr:sigma 54-interacting transcriptional regulator [Desulfopila aestuarii]SHO42600.1 PAS domain S-box-containing protein [Desulfopila aestuarii DSM 18488]